MSRTATTMRRAVADALEADERGHASPPAIDAERAAAFRTAQRHSRRVRMLRWVLPTAALGGLALISLVVWLDPLRLYRNLPVEFGRISITDNKLTIDAPKLTGFTQDRKPYSVTAQSAAQDLSKPNVIELNGISGQVELSNRGETAMHAKSGVYDMKAQTMRMAGGLEITATGGYRVQLKDAYIEIRKGHIVTENPVSAIFPDGSLDANRLEIFDHGERARFDGGVVMTFRMPSESGSGGKTAEMPR
jgi:lipopolysaccharide export system protein LptC